MAKFKLTSWLSNGDADKDKKQKNVSASTQTKSATKPQSDTAKAKETMTPPDSEAKAESKGDASHPAVTASSTSRMVALAKQITEESTKLEAYMKEHNLPLPDFAVDSPNDFPKLPEDILRSRHNLLFAARELELLAQGPRESLRWGVWSFLDVLALATIVHYGIAKLFPADTTIVLSELQARSRLDPVNLARLLRVAMTRQIFAEPEPGLIAHTAASRLLAEDDDLSAWLAFNGEDIFPAAGHVLQALETYPEAVHLTQTGFNFAFGTVDQEPMFKTFGKDPARAKRTGRAMASLTGGEGYEVRYLVDVEGGGYDFSEVDEAGGTLVDVGGSHGFVCVELAERYKQMKFVVQDLPKTVESAPRSEDEQIAERVVFQAHDFFTENPAKGADVYFFRWIMHNYSTPYAVKILKGLIPALKPGARIIINDHCLREPGQENPWDESIMRRMDLVMLTLLNAQERTEAEFKELFRLASDGFVFKGVTRPNGCRMSIVEAVWQPAGAEAEPKKDESAKEEPAEAEVAKEGAEGK